MREAVYQEAVSMHSVIFTKFFALNLEFPVANSESRMGGGLPPYHECLEMPCEISRRVKEIISG